MNTTGADRLEAKVTGSASRSGILASVGGLGAAVLASLCCIGPLLFVTLGVGAGLASTFEPLRPVFTALTIALLGVGFYVVYGPRPVSAPAESGQGASCAAPPGRRRDRVVLWAATLVAAALWSFPYWSRLLV
ncbi:MAG: mercury transporter MerT [Gemmatimonadetes bacterium]|nr:mercury transporter MerT [Gemmatimonadota bacterium]